MSSSPRNIDLSAVLLRAAMSDFEIPLTKYAVSILGDLEEARDVVQETFLKLYKQDPNRVGLKAKAWLFTVCRNRCYDVLKKNNRISNLEEDQVSAIPSKDKDPVEIINFFEGRDEINKNIKIIYSLIEKLPARQKEVMRLKFQADLTYKEIAETLDISISNVGFIVHSALKNLREAMNDKLND